MSKQTLKSSDIVVNKKEFYASKQALPLDSVNTNNLVVSYRIKHNDDGSKCLIGCSHHVFKPSCIILSQMSGYINYFDNAVKNMSFKIEEDSVCLKYTEKIHYVCIAAICIDSVVRVDNKNYPQVHLEHCKYKMRKRKLLDFIDDELDLSSDDSDYLDE